MLAAELSLSLRKRGLLLGTGRDPRFPVGESAGDDIVACVEYILIENSACPAAGGWLSLALPISLAVAVVEFFPAHIVL